MAFSLHATLHVTNLLTQYVFPKVKRMLPDIHQPSLAAHLPPEILSIIFLIYVQTPQPKSGDHEPRISCTSKTKTLPLPLTQVCSSWRSVALSTSRLWSKLHITGPTSGQLALASLWLERSGSAPLTLSFKEQPPITHCEAKHTCTFGDFAKIAPITFGLLSLFVEHVHRWEEIDFDLYPSLRSGSSSFPRVLAPVLGAKLPHLKSLAFNGDTREIWAAAYHNPFLRSVHFRDGQLSHRHRNILWSRLTTLRCDKISEEHFWFISYHCRALHSLHVEFFDLGFDPNRAALWASPVPETLSLVSLPQLRNFTVVFHCDPISGVFKHLRLPSLQKMMIDQMRELRNRIPEDIVDNVYGLLTSTGGSLKKLRLPSYLVTDESIKALGTSSNLLGLSVLELGRADVPVLQQLTLPHGVFPNLRKLNIVHCSSPERDLTQLLYSRMHSLNKALIILEYGSEIEGVPLDVWFRGPKLEIYDCHEFDIRTKEPRQFQCFYCGAQCNPRGNFSGVFH